MNTSSVVQTTVENFEETLKQTQKAFILFTGNKNEQGVSWCEDCVRAEPFFKEVVVPAAGKIGATFFICPVGERDVYFINLISSWKNPNHPLRSHKYIQVKSVPTLVWLENV
jgi:hypothetical protein